MDGLALDRFGVTDEQLEVWEADAARGIFQGEPRGRLVAGRPLLFGEPMRQIGFKEPLRVAAAIGERARQLGMSRSDYLRHIVEEDLKSAGLV